MAIVNVTSQQGVDSITVQWEDAETNAFTYEVWRSRSAGEYALVGTVAGNLKTYADSTGVFATDTYKIRKGIAPLINGNTFSSVKTRQPIAGVVFENVQGASIDNMTLLIGVNVGKTVKLNWGYGNDITLTAAGVPSSITSNFPEANRTYEIGLKGDIDEIVYFQMAGSEPNVTIQLSQFTQMTKLEDLILLCVFYGVPSDIPTSVTYLSLFGLGAAAVLGTDGLPPNIEYFAYTTLLPGQWIVNITNFPATLNYISSGPALGIVGDIANLPAGMTNFATWGEPGYTNIYGDLSDLKEGLIEFHCEHTGPDMTGDIATVPTTIETLFIVGYPDDGYMELTGSLTALMARCTIGSIILARCGDFSGSINDLDTPMGMCWLDNAVPWNTRSVTGDIANLPQCTGNGLTIASFNLTGDIKNIKLPTSAFGLYLVDNGGGITATAGVYPIWGIQAIIIREGLTTAEVDALLVGFAGTAIAGAATMTLTGGTGAYINQSRSAASDAAVATLQGLGKTILCNRA